MNIGLIILGVIILIGIIVVVIVGARMAPGSGEEQDPLAARLA